jgi:hypothetical protein
MGMTKSIKVGGFRKITEVVIPAVHGVVFAKGRNGVGKTTMIEAIEAAISKQQPPPVGDGKTSGYVDAKDAYGVTLTVGKTSRRSGELTVSSITGKLDISDIVDPKMKTPEAADAARIKALVALSGIEPTPELFAHLAGDAETFAKVTSQSTRETKDMLLLAERVKRDFEAAARLEEDSYRTITGKAEASEQAAHGIDTDQPSDRDVLQSALEEAIRAQQAIESQAEAAERRLRDHDAACDELALLMRSHGDLDIAGAEQRLEAAGEADDKAIDLVASLEKQLSEAKANQRETASNLRHAKEMLERLRQAEKTIAAVRANVETKPEPGPTQEAIDAASEATSKAREAVEQGSLVRAAKRHQGEAMGFRIIAERHRKQGERLRNAAAGVDQVLSEQIGKVFSQVWVEGGRLKTKTDRGNEYLHELSPGQLGRIAVEIGVKVVQGNGLLMCSQPVWEGIDPINQAEIDQAAYDNGVTIITAKCTADEELGVEIFNDRKAGE